jgi:hypothetical protein
MIKYYCDFWKYEFKGVVDLVKYELRDFIGGVTMNSIVTFGNGFHSVMN